MAISGIKILKGTYNLRSLPVAVANYMLPLNTVTEVVNCILGACDANGSAVLTPFYWKRLNNDVWEVRTDGFYVNGTCVLTSLNTRVFFVLQQISDTQMAVRRYTPLLDGMGYVDGRNRGGYYFQTQLTGWGNSIQTNYVIGSHTIQFYPNNEGGVEQYYPGIGNVWNGQYTFSIMEGETFDPEVPYSGAGSSEEGGGDAGRQNWDDASDAIVPDGLPTKGAMNSGMLKVFSPTATQVLDLTDLLFSYNFFDWLQKNLQNLEELFVSFGVVPFTVTKGQTVSVTFLGFDISEFTHPVYLTEAAEQYYEFDMGSIALDGSDPRIHASDSVFDYSPFSRLGIYLPFIGFQELDIDECRLSTINLKYRVDIISGSCVALIFLNNDEQRCIYQFSGNCISQIPLGSVDMSGIISGSIAIATAAAGAAAGSAVASAGDAFTQERLSEGKISEAGAELQNSQRAAQVSNAAGNLASATVNGIMGMKPNYKRSGAIGNTGGLMAVKQPYLFLTTPREAVPTNYAKYCGLPSNITDRLGNFSGYTVVEDIRLNGLVATSSEVEEIYQLLKSGVII